MDLNKEDYANIIPGKKRSHFSFMPLLSRRAARGKRACPAQEPVDSLSFIVYTLVYTIKERTAINASS